MVPKRNSGIYTRVTICFIIILGVLLLSVGIIIGVVCEDFIKKQRTEYNTKATSMANYETERLYFQMNQLLNSLKETYVFSRERRLSDTASAYEQIRSDLEFENSVKRIIYTNDFERSIDGVFFYYGKEDYYYIGNSVVSSFYKFDEAQFVDYYQGSYATYFMQGPITTEGENTSKTVLRFVLQPELNNYQKLKNGREELNPFIMIEVDMEKIKSILSQALSPDTGYALLDSTGKSIYSRDGNGVEIEGVMPFIKSHILSSQKYKLDTFVEGDVILTNIYLEKLNWLLVVGDSEKILYKDISSLMIKVELLIGLCGIVGILASMLMSRKLLFPMKLLKNIVAEVSEGKEYNIVESSNNEVTYVINLLENMKRQIQELHEKQLVLEVKEQEARLEMLQAQINPHFLHNTLDNIYCIAQIEEIESIVCLTKNLSNMMRYSLSSQKMFVELDKEIDHVKTYIGIINIRFENKISVIIDVREDLLQTEVIKLMLQPLIENSCVHGIFPKNDGQGNIWIRAEAREEDLCIFVEDDGIGFTQENADEINRMMKEEVKNIRIPKNNGFGIALVNVNDRIRLIDGEGYGISVENRKIGGARVMIKQKMKCLKTVIRCID